MNKEWSELNKTMQMQIKSKSSFCDGIMTLLLLRKKLIGQIADFSKELDLSGLYQYVYDVDKATSELFKTIYI